MIFRAFSHKFTPCSADESVDFMGDALVTTAKTVVTVQAVRVANSKMMSAGKGSPPPNPPAPRVVSALRDVATGGQRAMQSSLKKA